MSSAKLPDDVRRLIPKSHKVLAWSAHRGGFIVATNQALISTDAHDSTLTPWGNTVAARWNEPMLTVFVQHELDSQPTAMAWMLDDPGMVPNAVHDRVTSANLVDLAREIPGVGSVRFIARRSPQGTTWTTVLEGADVTASGELTAAQQGSIADELRELRSTLGI